MNRWSALIGGLALVVVSCGGESSSGEPPESAPETATPETDPPPDTAPPDTAPPETDSPTTAAPPTDPPATDPPPTDPAPTAPPATEDDEAEDTAVAERPDPCSVWTVADLQAATGLAFTEGVYNETLSVNGQDICDWIAAGGTIANAQVLVLAPGLDHDFLRGGTDTAFGPVTDLDIDGANAAHISVDGFILGIDIDGIVLQLAYLPPAGTTGTGDQLIQLANVAVANLSS